MSGRPRVVINQNGAPDPEVTADTVTIGRQSGEKTDTVEKTPAPAKKG